MRLWDRIETIPQSEARARLLGIGFMCVTALLWTGLEHFAALVPSKFFPYQLVWMRYGVHIAILLVLVAPRDGVRRIVSTTRPGMQIGRSLLMLAMPVVFMAAVRRGLPPGFVWFATWLSVPLTMGVAALLLRERVSMLQWLATLAALGGTWIVIHPPMPALDWRLVMPVVVMLAYGLYVPLTRALRTEHLGTNLFHTAFWVFLVLSLVVPFLWQPMSLKVLVAMANIGAWGFVILLLIDRAVTCAPASLVAPFILTECIWSMVLDRTLFGAPISPARLVGAGVVLVACATIAVREFGSNRSQPAVT